ncbi:type I restriction-modification system subunit M [Thermococcus sp. 21S7]|uniref:type I restriction-modification system subunit M n=1 Tax=Thermococcus sp. 21S7 TaxID=1638221 RepID=UPI001439F180|nr:type I restriction-modification system subunit M [Thermococcus sp. 21S7]NJE62451.1 N-6 DNA methylase [Thermococcus sp. 21S7]
MDRQALANRIEHIYEIMRAEGLSLLDYVEQLSWMLFLKVLSDREEERKLEAELRGEKYRPVIKEEYLFHNWPKRFGVDNLKKVKDAQKFYNFVANELWPYLSSLGGSDELNKIGEIFSSISLKIRDPHNLLEIFQNIEDISIDGEDSHIMSQLYEETLMLMGREGGAAGEYYTPRPIVRFMVKVVDPKIGETVFDPFCGSGGFLVEAYRHMYPQAKTAEDLRKLDEAFYGQELKPPAYLIANMNTLLHGVNAKLVKTDTFSEDIRNPGKLYDVILTNPPFGGKVTKANQENLPIKTSKTELAALQYVMRKVKPGGRVGIVLPDGVLSNVTKSYVKVRKELVEKNNVFAIVSLPQGVFANISPKGGTGPKASLLFFERGKPTKEIWYYELVPPNGKNYTRANPVKDEDLSDALEKFEAWKKYLETGDEEWKKKAISENSWVVSIEDIKENDYDLSAKNPNRKLTVEYPAPEEIIASLEEKERKIAELLGEIKSILGEKP